LGVPGIKYSEPDSSGIDPAIHAFDRVQKRRRGYPAQGRARGCDRDMPTLIPVPGALSRPFRDAVNQKRFVLRHCARRDRLQYPPQQTCQFCNSAACPT
jgi:hypothetical protein